MIVCTIQTYFYDHEVWFKLPHYPNSDGVVSEYSATAQGQRWQGTGIEVPQTDHNELVHLDSNAEVVLNDIFNGLEGRVPLVQMTIFNLNE